jgi:flavin reductase (DIM6/NTAB) family NADH-FMN oxidoreductase RutF
MRKIWNRPNQQVWSLSTIDETGTGNSNICTYVTAVSMEPKLMMVAVYHGTKTYQNVVATKRAVLQLLSQELAPAVRICGHMSGNDIAKIKRLQKRYEINLCAGIPYFVASAGYLELELSDLVPVGGDHDLAVFAVTQHKNLNGAPLLTTDYLREHGFLR